MGWFKAGKSKSNTYSNTYTSQVPILSENWDAAIGGYRNNLNAAGANLPQQQAIDFYSNNLRPGGNFLVNGIGDANAYLGDIGGQIGDIGNRGPYTVGAAPTTAFQGMGAVSAATAQSDSAPTVNARTGATYLAPYESKYTTDVVNSTLGNFDRQAGTQLAGLRAQRDAGSAFGDRSALADSNYMTASDMNRAQAEAQLRNLGFNTAAGFGMQDANRFLSADTTNATNTLANNQFNAGQQNQQNQLNARLAAEREQFNTTGQNAADTANAKLQAERDQFNVQALTQAEQKQLQALQAQAGLAQQQVQNLVTANGVNMDLAKSLLDAGTITQGQFATLANLAAEENGTAGHQVQTTNNRGSNFSIGF